MCRTVISHRSYEEALKTDHLCSTYQCGDVNYTQTFITNLKKTQSFPCYHRPESVKHVYLNSGSHNQSGIALAFYFICTSIGVCTVVLWCILPVLSFIYRHRKSWGCSNKQLGTEEDPYLYVAYV